MKDVNSNLETFFDITPKETTEVKAEVKKGLTAAAGEDYAFARQNLRSLIQTGSEGLEGILKVAMESVS